MSTRVLFYRPPVEFVPTNGEIVRQLQAQLLAAGFDPQGRDGVYGGNTVKALKQWQTANGQTPTGEVTEDTWQKLLGVAAPSAEEKALQLTAAFEGTGFQKVVGNFDGAWLTWGIVGFTLSNGELDRILTRIATDHAGLFDKAFGDLAKKMRSVLTASMSDQRKFADSISIGPKKYRVLSEWAEAFARLGSLPEVQRIQLEETERYWKIARKQFTAFKMKTEVGLSLMFDTAVQNGGLEEDEEKEIRQIISASPPKDERELCAIIGKVVAQHSNFPVDVRSRKLAIAEGSGVVHGDKYLADAWGIDEFDV